MTTHKTDSRSETNSETQVEKSAAHDDAQEQGASFHKGDKVAWDASQGTVHGTVERKLTQPMKIKTHEVKASQDNPEYLVKSDKTGAEAAHKPSELRKETQK